MVPPDREESWLPYLRLLQDLDPIHLEADLELRLRHVGGSGYGQSTSSDSCAAAQLVQLPGKEPWERANRAKAGAKICKNHFLDL